MSKIKIFESSPILERKVEERVNDFISKDNVIIEDIQLSTAFENSGVKNITIMVLYQEIILE